MVDTNRYLVPGCFAFATSAATIGAYLALRPHLLRHGASDDEVARQMPSDALVPDPNYVTDRAITIETPPEDVWPWLVQIGEFPRGGFCYIEIGAGMAAYSSGNFYGLPGPRVTLEPRSERWRKEKEGIERTALALLE